MPHTFEKIFDSWQKVLCPKVLGQKCFNLDCVKGKCLNCGFHILPIYTREANPTNESLMPWRRFQKVLASEIWVREPKEVVQLVSKLTNPWEFLDFATPKVHEFVMHEHIARWQYFQYKLSQEMLKEGEIFSFIDFAKNYSFKH
jgi:hypothetical protein